MTKTQRITRLSMAVLMAIMATLFMAGPSAAAADLSSPSICPTPPPTFGTHLCVTVWPDGVNQAAPWRLTCQPPSVDWGLPPSPYDPNAACDALQKHPEAIPPVPPGTICLQVFFGPQRSNLQGYYDGQWIDADFSRNNSCEESRWAALKPVWGTFAG
jgi:hypothetical protein